jgi:predicted membrane chloride channel (bestrophin family)
LFFTAVFKTNTSYGRWDEARKAWGVIVNSSRTILRQGAAWLQETNIPERDKIRLIARLAAAVWCFPRSLTRHVLSAREDDAAYAEDCRANLRPDLAEDLIAARHKPTRATYEISCAINDLPLSDIQKATLEYSVNQLCDAMGANDRILSSPVPLVYTRHLARFLEVWLLMLPLGLWPDFTNSWNHIAMYVLMIAE